jgi:NitT/TauT family transport system permease protein
MTAQVAMAVPVISELEPTVVEAGDLEPAIELAARGRPGLLVRAVRSVAVFVLILVSMLVLWELFKVLTGQSDRTMPHVWTITDYLFSETSQGELYLSYLVHNMYVTGRGAVIGLVIGTAFGLTSGIVIARSRLAGSALLPLIVAAQTVPIVALAPALVLWLGTGSLSKAAIAAYLTFFPVAVATAKGIQNVPGSSIDVMRTYSAGRWMVLGTVQLPFALPMIFVGLETAAALSVVGAIVAELPFGAREGLGVAILTSWQFYTVQPAALYCAAIGSCVLGALIVMVIRALRMIALRNRPPGGDVL